MKGVGSGEAVSGALGLVSAKMGAWGFSGGGGAGSRVTWKGFLGRASLR